jgi:hypothetical protein
MSTTDSEPLRIRNTTSRPVELHLAGRVVVVAGYDEIECTADDLELGAVDALLRRGTLHLLAGSSVSESAKPKARAKPRTKRAKAKTPAKPPTKRAKPPTKAPAPPGRRGRRQGGSGSAS